MRKILISSITDLSTQRAVNARVYIGYYFITDGENVFINNLSPVCNSDPNVLNAFLHLFKDCWITKVPIAIVPEFVGTITLGG